MGVAGLLGELPGGSMEETQHGFSQLAILLDGIRRVDLDTGTLCYVCALRHKEAFNAGNYTPSARDFQAQIITLRLVHRWDFTCVFDGRPPPAKRHEHTRRRQHNDGVVMTSTFIAICANICRNRFLPYVVAPLEADMQIGRRSEGTVAVCRDSDEVAYGNRLTVIVDSWPKEQYRVIDLDAPVSNETRVKHPLFFYYRKFGIKVFHWWAAVMGCDISENQSGITGAGKTTFYLAMQEFDVDRPSSLTSRSFAKKLREHARRSCRASYSVVKIQRELERVNQWFTKDATFYDESCNE